MPGLHWIFYTLAGVIVCVVMVWNTDDNNIHTGHPPAENRLNHAHQGSADVLQKRRGKEKKRADNKKSLSAFQEVIRDWVYPWVKYLDHMAAVEPTQHCLSFKRYLMGVAPKDGIEAKKTAEWWRLYASRHLGPVI